MRTHSAPQQLRDQGELQLLREENPSFAGTLAKGMMILQCFVSDPRPLANSELAQRLGMPRPTISRLCRTLQGQHVIGCVDDGTRRGQIAWRQPSRTAGTAGGKALQELRLLVAKRRIRVNRGQGVVLGCRHRVQPGPGSSSEFQ